MGGEHIDNYVLKRYETQHNSEGYYRPFQKTVTHLDSGKPYIVDSHILHLFSVCDGLCKLPERLTAIQLLVRGKSPSIPFGVAAHAANARQEKVGQNFISHHSNFTKGE